jgi:acetyl-CoA carboxylase biotin carboxyl carrier protein
MEEREALEAMLEIMREHDLDALTVRSGEHTVELVRRAEAAAAASNAPVEATPQVPVTPNAPVAAATFKKITAPIIGVFYLASAPGAETFANVGDRVEVGQVVCILEAMKLMNEITSDYSGIVRRILPENGALVSLGEELFWIEP